MNPTLVSLVHACSIEDTPLQSSSLTSETRDENQNCILINNRQCLLDFCRSPVFQLTPRRSQMPYVNNCLTQMSLFCRHNGTVNTSVCGGNKTDKRGLLRIEREFI